MAAKEEHSTGLQIEFVLSEHEPQAVKGKLLIEFIKYLLYDRHQVPSTIDQLRQQTQLEVADAGKKSKRTALRADLKKRQKIISDLELLFANIEDLFSTTWVSSAVVIYGSTAVSPKESYVMSFKSKYSLNSSRLWNKENESVSNLGSANRVCRKLIRTLITNRELRSFQEIPPLPMLVFLQVPRTVRNSWFRPKPSFKVPWRGNCCRILIRSPETTEESDGGVLEEYIWLQAPVSIKGYREKTKDDTVVYSDFWT